MAIETDKIMKRVKYVVLVLVLLIGAFFVSSILSSQNKSDLRKASKKDIKNNSTIVVENKNYKFPIISSGRIYAFNKVEIYAEVSGVLENNNNNKFKAGNKFNKGETLVKINSDVYYNSLLATKSNLLNQLTILLSDLKSESSDYYKVWLKYLENFDITKPLNPLPENLAQRQKIFLASHNILNLYYQIKGMEATYKKYKIEAPFKGVLTTANINSGTLVRSGQKLGEFINTSLFEIEVPIKYSDLNKIKIGGKAELISLNKKVIKDAKIVRINDAVDQQTQSVKIYIQSKNKKLIDGMFCDVKIYSGIDKKLAKIPINAISDNNNVKIKIGNSAKYVPVKIVDKTLTDYFVEGLENNSVVYLNQTKQD